MVNESEPLYRKTNDGLIVKVRIVPNSSKNDIIIEDEFIKIKVTAQPIENKANKSLIEFLSKHCKVPKTSIQIVKGETCKDKTILFAVKDENKQAEILDKIIN